jgi:hypothetical protein
VTKLEFFLWAWNGFWPGALMGAIFGTLVVGADLIRNHIRTGRWRPSEPEHRTYVP